MQKLDINFRKITKGQYNDRLNTNKWNGAKNKNFKFSDLRGIGLKTSFC